MITWVNTDIKRTLSGWFCVGYEFMDKDGQFYFTDKLFDTLKEARQFIAKCKKEIKENEKKSDKLYKQLVG